MKFIIRLYPMSEQSDLCSSGVHVAFVITTYGEILGLFFPVLHFDNFSAIVSLYTYFITPKAVQVMVIK